ncbi:tetrahydromethanopterin S-methyltransferase subunit H family protein [Pseudonocardia endophytica]|uniref:Tetrahydromethanopterin S-methyltransferase subunit H n=1 Tax=Pseudonocardia endophytica TaxID=401976 RepID=A0A4R1HHS9_PSEEN|nr:tetrahydromethanopterin S-methyltransferase subunit H [Pseudonocardia endophytica]TCK21318.1 tetrahydromethanopterin S-methyltransferase subunit H [Pseudonocardia endophytica]
MELHEITLGDVTIGGPLGSSTGLMVGSIFYDNHSVVTDAFAGEFDRDRANTLIERADKAAAAHGVQMAYDVIAASPEAIQAFLPFVAERSRAPMLINASEAEVRIAGLETAADLGVLERCVFASLNMDTEDEELDALRKHRPGAVMIMANDGADPSPDGCCTFIEEFYKPMLDDIGVTAPIADLGTMDAPSVGSCMRGIAAVRERFGYPAGCAFSNCISQWTGLRELGREYINYSLGAALVACRAYGGDFLHYGVIEKSRAIAHIAGSAEVFFGFAAQELDGHKLPENHALLKMFKLANEYPS